MEIVPRDDWFQLTYLLIEHGRAVCTAKRPRCGECLLQRHLPVGVQGLRRGRNHARRRALASAQDFWVGAVDFVVAALIVVAIVLFLLRDRW